MMMMMMTRLHIVDRTISLGYFIDRVDTSERGPFSSHFCPKPENRNNGFIMDPWTRWIYCSSQA